MRLMLYLLLILAAVPLLGIAQESENIQIVRAMTQAINDRDLDGLDKFIASNVVRHSAATPDPSIHRDTQN
jgi:hypothetical protein